MTHDSPGRQIMRLVQTYGECVQERCDPYPPKDMGQMLDAERDAFRNAGRELDRVLAEKDAEIRRLRKALDNRTMTTLTRSTKEV